MSKRAEPACGGSLRAVVPAIPSPGYRQVFPSVITLTLGRDVCHGIDLPPVVYLNTVSLISGRE
jgi:hypothetical protein